LGCVTQRIYESQKPVDRRSVKRRKIDSEVYLESISVRNIQKSQSDDGREPWPTSLGSDSMLFSYVSSEKQNIASRRTVPDCVQGASTTEFSREDPPCTPARRNGGVFLRDDLLTRSPTSSSEDYNSWEAGISMEEMRMLQRELVGSGTLQSHLLVLFSNYFCRRPQGPRDRCGR
jgi:hypothetical protein